MSIHDETWNKCHVCGQTIKTYHGSYHDSGWCKDMSFEEYSKPKKEMTDKQKLCLIQDDDGHWYICPWEKREEASEYFDKVFYYWEFGAEKPNSVFPVQPEWLRAVDGPHRISFCEYWEE